MGELIWHTDLAAALKARPEEWHAGVELDGPWRGNEFAGELAEAAIVCNTIKKLSRAELGLPGGQALLEQLADELGDAVITSYLIGQHYDINVTRAVARKFNKTSAKHGFPSRLFYEGLRNETSGG